MQICSRSGSWSQIFPNDLPPASGRRRQCAARGASDLLAGNLSEYAPIFLILLRLFDQVATPALWLHVPGATLRRGHLMHAAVFVFLAPNVCLRLGRKILTLLAVLAAAGRALHSSGF